MMYNLFCFYSVLKNNYIYIYIIYNMSNFIILPTQLFDKKYLDKSYNYIIWEHPHYFLTYKYNKKKIILHRASCSYYYDYLKKNNFNVIDYIEYTDKKSIKKYTKNNYIIFDPIDKIKLNGEYTIINNPNFLLSNDLVNEYRNKTDKFFFNAFYMWSKKQLDIIPTIKSQDKFNRKKMPENINIPKLISNKSNLKYIKKGIDLVNNNFKNNYGNVNNFIYPITHESVNKWLDNFIKNKLKDFGNYQDYIDKNNQYLFHSILSSSINIGLIQPIDIIEKILKYNKSNKNKIPINSLEGFIRQLFWREYQRYCYLFVDYKNKNYFKNSKKLNKDWYSGTLGIKPVDDCIINGFDTGYLHHIQRLMVVGNYMNLYGLHPKEGFKWFMEFSCDSYEWVMYQNVYDMVFFATGGLTMRRPYISSSNYIINMSNYNKKNEWTDKWDTLYHNFIKKNKKLLWKFRYYFPSLNKN